MAAGVHISTTLTEIVMLNSVNDGSTNSRRSSDVINAQAGSEPSAAQGRAQSHGEALRQCIKIIRSDDS